MEEKTPKPALSLEDEHRAALLRIDHLHSRLAEALRRCDYLEQENIGLRWAMEALRRDSSAESSTNNGEPTG